MCAAPAAPGLSREAFLAPSRPGLRTAVPAFLGYAAEGPVDQAVEVERAGDFAHHFGPPLPGGYLAAAVSAFFGNGGESCRVVRVDDARGRGEAAEREALGRALAALQAVEAVDLVCAPELMQGVVALAAAARPVTRADRDQARAAAVAMQRQVLEHCDRAGDRMALLDSVPGDGRDGVLEQRGRLAGTNGALYFPWLVAEGGGWVPPCGHVAGVYARGDAAVGVHKAPANERLQGVQDVEVLVDDAVQRDLNPAGINCIRAFRGRGVRVWGARTLSPDPAWTHVGVRRVFLTLRRWIALNLPGVAFEPSQPLLWARIGREVRAYLEELYRRGALRGRSPAEAFYVRCDASLNPPEVRAAGVLVTEIGLAPVVPSEFVVVRFTHGPGGVDLAAPGPPA
jgi:phage tail sheath protein FI